MAKKEMTLEEMVRHDALASAKLFAETGANVTVYVKGRDNCTQTIPSPYSTMPIAPEIGKRCPCGSMIPPGSEKCVCFCHGA